jgi:hypothetical protein
MLKICWWLDWREAAMMERTYARTPCFMNRIRWIDEFGTVWHGMACPYMTCLEHTRSG